MSMTPGRADEGCNIIIFGRWERRGKRESRHTSLDPSTRVSRSGPSRRGRRFASGHYASEQNVRADRRSPQSKLLSEGNYFSRRINSLDRKVTVVSKCNPILVFRIPPLKCHEFFPAMTCEFVAPCGLLVPKNHLTKGLRYLNSWERVNICSMKYWNPPNRKPPVIKVASHDYADRPNLT